MEVLVFIILLLFVSNVLLLGKVMLLKGDLKDAQKNDHRDPKTGRFVKRR